METPTSNPEIATRYSLAPFLESPLVLSNPQCRGGGSGHRVQRPVVYKDPDESNLRSHTLPLWGRQTIGGDRPSRPSARRGQRDHERSWAKRVFVSSLHTSRSKVREEGHPSCQARTGENSCVHTALLHTALLHTNALSQ